MKVTLLFLAISALVALGAAAQETLADGNAVDLTETSADPSVVEDEGSVIIRMKRDKGRSRRPTPKPKRKPQTPKPTRRPKPTTPKPTRRPNPTTPKPTRRPPPKQTHLSQPITPEHKLPQVPEPNVPETIVPSKPSENSFKGKVVQLAKEAGKKGGRALGKNLITPGLQGFSGAIGANIADKLFSNKGDAKDDDNAVESTEPPASTEEVETESQDPPEENVSL